MGESLANNWNCRYRRLYDFMAYDPYASLFGTLGSHMPEGAPTGNVTHEGFPQGSESGEHFPRELRSRGVAGIPQLEFFQMAFIVLYSTLALMISRKQKIAARKQSEDKK